MNSDKRQLLEWIERDRDRIINFLSEFIRAKSPYPPGDTRAAADCVINLLEGEGIPFTVPPTAAWARLTNMLKSGSC